MPERLVRADGYVESLDSTAQRSKGQKIGDPPRTAEEAADGIRRNGVQRWDWLRRDHEVGAQVAHAVDGHGVYHCAINHLVVPERAGRENARDGEARPDTLEHRPRVDQHLFAGTYVHGDRDEWQDQALERRVAHLFEFGEQPHDGGPPEQRRPAQIEVVDDKASETRANASSERDQALDRDLRGQCGADDRPHAGTADVVDGNASAFEDAEHPQVRESIGAARAERNTDRTAGEVPCNAVARLLRRPAANDLAGPLAAPRLERPLAGASALEPAVSEALGLGASQEDQRLWAEDSGERALERQRVGALTS